MCGIAGIVSKDPSEISLGRVKKMTDSIVHRGPDGEGQWLSDDGKVGLGHRRLSIIDLSVHANQPMHYLDRYSIVFNGEIYNYIELRETLLKQGYTFHTASDTEVLMALYDRDKENCLQLLDGMFSFAIYDKKEHRVFCAVDRFGEKPFHYHHKPGHIFFFGSEMKTLWAAGVPRNVNRQMLFNYLQYAYVRNFEDQQQTFFEDIKRLEQSHYLILDVQTLQITITRYWDINLTSKCTSIKEADAFEQFRELFNTSIKRRLRSDVPVGSSLSGGLDSSLVVSVINELNQDRAIHQKTFSAQFPGFERDESRFQQMVIDRTGADAFFTQPNAQTMLREMDKVFYHQEEPFGSSSIMAQYEVFKLAKQHGVTVLLDGQGADEYLAGYHAYYQFFFIELERNKKEYQHQWEAYSQLHSQNPVNTTMQKGLRYYLRSVPALFELARKINTLLDFNRGSFTSDYYRANRLKRFNSQTAFDTLNGMLRQSTIGGGLQDLLRYADRCSMAHSLEVRLPFLYHELVEFVFSLPSTYKINKGWTKYIARKAFEHIMPEEITWRVDKIGYEPPQKKWMESDTVREIIQENKRVLVKAGILDKDILNKPVVSVATSAVGINSWAIWQAGELIAPAHTIPTEYKNSQ